MRGHKNINDCHDSHWRNFFSSSSFHVIRVLLPQQYASKADCLSKHVVPLNIQNKFLYYDTMPASQSSTIIKFAKWAFFWILLVPGPLENVWLWYCPHGHSKHAGPICMCVRSGSILPSKYEPDHFTLKALLSDCLCENRWYTFFGQICCLIT